MRRTPSAAASRRSSSRSCSTATAGRRCPRPRRSPRRRAQDRRRRRGRARQGGEAGPRRARVTGFEAGAVAPFPLPEIDRVLIDPGCCATTACGSAPGRIGTGLAPSVGARPAQPRGSRRRVRRPRRIRFSSRCSPQRRSGNEQFVDWADATIHVGTHGIHYGSGVFEGIRAYETPKGTAVFRLTEHLKRLHNSAKILYMELPYSTEELRDVCHELIESTACPSATCARSPSMATPSLA